MKEVQNKFDLNGVQNSNTINKPHHQKIQSLPYIQTNSNNFEVHKINIYPKEDKRQSFFPLIIKNKRTKKTKDLYSRLKNSPRYLICSKKQIDINNKLNREKNRNFRLITDSSSCLNLPPNNPSLYRHLNVNNTNRNISKGQKSIDVFNEECFEKEKNGSQDKMIDAIFKKNIRPEYHYQYPTEFDRIHIDDYIKLYKNQLTIPTQPDADNDGDEIETVINIRLQRYKKTYIKEKTQTHIEKQRKQVIVLDEQAQETKLKEINDCFHSKYQKEGKVMFKNEMKSALKIKEVLSNQLKLIIYKDVEKFNKMKFDSEDGEE